MFRKENTKGRWGARVIPIELSTFRCGECRTKWIVRSTRLQEPKTPLSPRANLIPTPCRGRKIGAASSGGLIYFVHLAVERDESPREWKRDTTHNPSFNIAWLSLQRKREKTRELSDLPFAVETYGAFGRALFCSHKGNIDPRTCHWKTTLSRREKRNQ